MTLTRFVFLLVVLAAPMHSGFCFAAKSSDVEIVVPSHTCDKLDIFDTPARAIRLPDKSILLISSHYINRSLRGLDFDHMEKRCAVLYTGTLNNDPSAYDYKTWITAMWIDNTGNLIALGHNEYHADEIPGACIYHLYEECWYNTIVLLFARNEYSLFERENKKIHRAVIAPDFTADIGQGHPRGYFSPTNFIKKDGFLYTLVRSSGEGLNDSGRCVLRSTLPVSQSSWQILTASGYVPPNQDPYSDQTKIKCRYVTGLRGFVGSISNINNSDIYVATSVDEDNEGGLIALYYSRDLINWSDRFIVKRASTFWSKKCNTERVSYPSLIDVNSTTSVNFDTISLHPTLFFVRVKCSSNLLNRDLMEMKINIVVPKDMLH